MIASPCARSGVYLPSADPPQHAPRRPSALRTSVQADAYETGTRSFRGSGGTDQFLAIAFCKRSNTQT